MKWNRNIIAAIQLLADNAGAERIAVQADHQVQHSRTVIRLDRLPVITGGENLLCQVKCAIVSLLKGQARVALQLLEADLRLLCQRMSFP